MMFESRVVLDGNQTGYQNHKAWQGFESRVVLDGNQTLRRSGNARPRFESRVVLDGNQTSGAILSSSQAV